MTVQPNVKDMRTKICHMRESMNQWMLSDDPDLRSTLKQNILGNLKVIAAKS